MSHISRQRRKANERRRSQAAIRRHNLVPDDFLPNEKLGKRVGEHMKAKEQNVADRAAEREAYRAAHPGNFSPGWEQVWAKARQVVRVLGKRL